jgi:hypothetical protein
MTRGFDARHQIVSATSNFYESLSKKRHRVPETNIIHPHSWDTTIKIFIPSDETNAWCASSIRVQPESRAAVGQPENFKKNPAVAAAGPVTRILSGR